MRGISSERKWRSSESIALSYLERQGFQILETRKKVKVEGVEVGEVDAIALSPEGEKYAVEIKSGRVDVTGIRQAYVNAELLGLKPLVIAKGFADDSAKALAESLGVMVIELSDAFLVDVEELEVVVESAVERVFREVLEALSRPVALGPQEERVVEALAGSADIKEFAERLGCSIEEAMRYVKKLQAAGLFPSSTKSFWGMKLYAQLYMLRKEYSSLKMMLQSLLRAR